MNLGMIFKMLGVKISDEDIHKLELLLPQVPTLVNNFIGTVNGALMNFDGRLKNLEQSNVELHRKLDLLLGAEDVNTARADTNGNRRINGVAADAGIISRTAPNS